jgi:hypothetical protein
LSAASNDASANGSFIASACRHSTARAIGSRAA